MIGIDEPANEPKWVSSHRAVEMLEKAGINDPVTLAYWAEDGKLHARAARAKRNGEDEKLWGLKIDALLLAHKAGEHDKPCPIPDDFWLWVRVDEGAYTNWGAGIFAATVNWIESDHRECSEHWRFFNVTFHSGELQEQIRLAKSGAGPALVHEPRAEHERWQKQRVSLAQEQVFKFFGFATWHLPGGPEELTKTDLRRSYAGWHKKEGIKSEPLARTAFEKMLVRHRRGWRIKDNRWQLLQ